MSWGAMLLLEDLLDVSRITRGTLQLRKQPTELAFVVEAAVETARPAVDSKRHTLRVELPDAAVKMNVDPLRMSQVLSNLLTNAAKYTNAGGNVLVNASVDGRDLTVRIADDGIGLTAEEIGSIFTMFSQSKSAQERSEGGLGIGLALTKGLVELHGGTIKVRSDGPGLGCTFQLHFPETVITDATQIEAAARPMRPFCDSMVMTSCSRMMVKLPISFTGSTSPMLRSSISACPALAATSWLAASAPIQRKATSYSSL
jgi:signal transduction histidine kinase